MISEETPVKRWTAKRKSALASELVIAALNMALHTRRPESVIHHSDQGSHQRGVWQALRGNGRETVDGHGGRCVRQRHGRELLCNLGVRTH